MPRWLIILIGIAAFLLILYLVGVRVMVHASRPVVPQHGRAIFAGAESSSVAAWRPRLPAAA